MRRSDKAVTERAEIDAILEDARVLHLGMCSLGEPYLVPLVFGYDAGGAGGANGAVYVHAAREGRKLDILRENPRVCFEVETDVEILPREAGCGWGVRFRSVIGTGRAEFVEEPAQKRRALDVIIAHYGGSPLQFAGEPAAAEALSRVAVVRIDIDELTGKRSG